jgi:hypothetical protein
VIDLLAGALANPSAWGWAGFGYGFPGGTVSAESEGLRLDWNPAPTQSPDNTQCAFHPLTWVVGHRYLAKITVDSTVDVRMVQPFTQASAWARAGQNVEVWWEFTVSAGPDTFGIESAPAPGATSTLVRELTVFDLTASQAGERVPLMVVPGVSFLDPFRVVLPLTIQYGRSDVGNQPDAASLTFGWLGDLTLAYGAGDYRIEVGMPIQVEFRTSYGVWDDIWEDTWIETGGAVVESRRFTGRVGALAPSREGRLVQTEITCVGEMATLAATPSGTADWPAESEAARVARVVADAGPGLVGTGEAWGLVARAAERSPVLDILRQMASALGALVVERRDGVAVYEPASVRAAGAGASSLVLDDYEILDDVGWAQQIDVLVNDITATYGTAPDGGDRPWYRASSAESVSRFGLRHTDIETPLANLADVQTFVAGVIQRWAFPSWEAPQVLVWADILSDAQWAALMSLAVGSVIETKGVTTEPAASGGSARWFVEGWREEYSREDGGRLVHDFQVAVSDPARWRPADKTATSITASGPGSIQFGSTATITGTLTTPDGPAGGQTVRVMEGSTRLNSGTTSANSGAFSIPLANLGVGRRVLTVEFVGSGLLLPSSTQVVVDVTQVTSTAVSLTVSPNPVRNGQTATLTATVTPSSVSGRVSFERSLDGGAWEAVSSSAISGGKAAWAWSANSPTRAWRWRAVLVPNSGFAPATSSPVSVDVLAKTSRTIEATRAWEACYRSDGSKRSDTNDLYQGYYSGTNGNQRSLVGFNYSIPAGATVTKVEVYLNNAHFGSAAGGQAVVGSHSKASEPATWTGSGVSDDLKRFTMARYATGWFDITSAVKAIIQSGTMKGIAIGPAPSTALTYYGSFKGGTTRLRITIEEWT